MKSMKLSCLFLLIAVFSYAADPTEDAENVNTSRLQSVLDSIAGSYHIPGIQVTVSNSQNKTWTGASGYTDFSRKTKIKPDALFKIGSTTKMFTAALIMNLIDGNMLSLDDPLSKWYPDFPDARNITIRNLLSHTSGIPDFLGIFSIVSKTFMSSKINWDPEKIIKIVSKKKPDFKPGTDFRYSNTNYHLLGLIAEKVTGKKTNGLFAENFFYRHDMSRSFLLPDYGEKSGDLIDGIDIDYLPFGPNRIKGKNLSWDSLLFTSGAMVSNTRDIFKWYKNFFEGNAVSSRSFELMRSYLTLNGKGPAADMTGYGLGLAEYENDGEKLSGHPGGVMGYETFPVYCPAKKYYIIIMINITKKKSPMMDIFRDIRDKLLPEI